MVEMAEIGGGGIGVGQHGVQRALRRGRSSERQIPPAEIFGMALVLEIVKTVTHGQPQTGGAVRSRG
jgi:hypothetical protein